MFVIHIAMVFKQNKMSIIIRVNNNDNYNSKEAGWGGSGVRGNNSNNGKTNIKIDNNNK